ncbi:hypothetical protein HDU79_008637 [Rhizoclosmatium sp. JEL0117]|nr:hypothetical protein HDU79_008637 [Rhizoclosmatium sp. JEL0117]
MIAIGGTIGTGLLLKSGSAIYTAGPLGALICFVIAGFQVFFVSSAIGEMAAFLPMEGAFSHMPTRFVNPAFGFASGWNYWLSWVLGVPAELSAISSFMAFWTTAIPSWAWTAIYLVPVASVNLLGVSSFGETEFALSLIKVIAIVIFLFISLLMWFGVGQSTGPLWFVNWSPALVGDDSLTRFNNIASAMTTAFFSFGGTELIGLTASEAENPRVSIPKAINGTFIRCVVNTSPLFSHNLTPFYHLSISRILLFYLGSILMIGLLLSPDNEVLDPNNPAGISQSPFVYVYNSFGIKAAEHIMNAVIILATLSAANSSIYACSRTLTRLAEENSAPKFLGRVDSRGVPVASVALSILFGVIAIIGGYLLSPQDVFNFLSNLIALAIEINWLIMSYTHLRFRAGFLAQGYKLADLPYVAPFYPYADYLSLVMGLVVSVFLVFGSFYNVTTFDQNWFIAQSWLYAGVPLTILWFLGKGVWDGYKKGNVLSGFALVPLMEMDFETGRYVEAEGETQGKKQGLFTRLVGKLKGGR